MKTTLILLATIILCQLAAAQTKSENIDLLFRLMKKDSLMELNAKRMTNIKQLSSLFGNSYTLSASDSIKLKQKIETYKAFYSKLIVEEKALYDKHFTENEISDMIRFYQSPTGVKMIKESAVIQDELSNILMTKYASELIKLNTEKQ